MLAPSLCCVPLVPVGRFHYSGEAFPRPAEGIGLFILVFLKIDALFDQKCGLGQLHLASFPSCPGGGGGGVSLFKSQAVTQWM